MLDRAIEAIFSKYFKQSSKHWWTHFYWTIKESINLIFQTCIFDEYFNTTRYDLCDS